MQSVPDTELQIIRITWARYSWIHQGSGCTAILMPDKLKSEPLVGFLMEPSGILDLVDNQSTVVSAEG